MGSPAALARIVHFGVFELDLKASELRKQGLRLKLPEQPFQVLAMLLEKPGEIVTRDELRNRLWQTHTFVDFDHGLNNAVMRLREVLGDSSENPRFVETIPRRGYRFIAHVDDCFLTLPSQRVQESDASQLAPLVVEAEGATRKGLASPGNKRGNSIRIMVSILALVVAAAFVTAITMGYFGPRNVSQPGPKQSTSIVVLPLENLSGNQTQDYFADGMTDELIANLAKIRSLRVISRSTAIAYKGTRKPLSEIARELHVDAVVEGTVLREGSRIRITAELVQVSTDRHLWAETYESQIGDVLALQNRVSSAIVNEIRINLTPEDRARLAKNPAIAPEA
jgi:TolB-like protein/DNA-binding winged helix-turn-helix (wHTH) protein